MKKAFTTTFAKLDWNVQKPQAVNKQDEQPIDKDEKGSFFEANVMSGSHPSTLVRSIDYNGTSLTLTVTYQDGFRATYHDIEPDLAKEFSESDSKGKWALEHLWDRSYS